MENFTPLKLGEVKNSYTTFEDWLIKFANEHEIDVYVVEDFVFRPGFKEGQWKKTDDSKIIGCVRTIAKVHGKPCIEQPPAIKPVGYGMAGMKYVKGKSGTHMQDAVAHGVFYYRTKGIKLAKN